MTVEGYDEAHAAPGVPRPHYAALLERLDGADLASVRARVDASLSAGGVTFGPEPFAVDPIPRLLAPGEWATLAAGLEQRVRALNAFVADAYGARRIVAEGILPAAMLDGAEGFEPDLAGRLPAGVPPIGVAGLDVVREPGGALLVLEDNLRTPSGLAYAVAARHAVAEALGLDEPDPEGSFDPARGRAARRRAGGLRRGALPRRAHRRTRRRRPLGARARSRVAWMRRSWPSTTSSTATAASCCATAGGASTSSTAARTRTGCATTTAP